MKQLLLRVDDRLHADLTAHAKAADRSVNSLANEVLQLAVQPSGTRRDRLAARLAALGAVDMKWGEIGTTYTREDAVEELRGAGPLIDEALATERDRG